MQFFFPGGALWGLTGYVPTNDLIKPTPLYGGPISDSEAGYGPMVNKQKNQEE